MFSQKKEQEIETFHNVLEALEECLEKAEHYVDKDSRKYLYQKTIKEDNAIIDRLEELFLTKLLNFVDLVNENPIDFRRELQKEFNQWINEAGIEINNYPKRLKYFLFEISEILEDRGEEFIKQVRRLVQIQLSSRNKKQENLLVADDKRMKINKEEAFEEVEKRVSAFRQRSYFRKNPRTKKSQQVDNNNDMDIDKIEISGSQLAIQEQLTQQPKGRYEFINGNWVWIPF